MNHYRFSISWARVLPDGDISNINEAGLVYYDKLIDALLANKIEPMVTMYHYDMPQAFAKFGGLTNSILVGHFESYANLLFERYGKRVKYWITFNEPLEFCLGGYTGGGPPLIAASGVGEYLCGNNVLKSHGAAYRLYEKRYKEKFGGKVGISLSSSFYYGNETDVDRAMQFRVSYTLLNCLQFLIFPFVQSLGGSRMHSSAKPEDIRRS